MTTEHEGKIALVTGANKGIGREIARRLAGLGMTVFASARDEKRGKQAAAELQKEGGDIRFLQLDVTDEASVKQAAEQIDTAFQRLDVLVNNAGIITERERPPTNALASEVTVDEMRRTYEVNVFGVVAVTRAMLPLLRRSPAARIVNMSSPLGSLSWRASRDNPAPQPGLLAYNSSKAAQNAVTLHYANELRGAGILVNAANPGKVGTDLNRHTGERTVEQGANIAMHLATLGAYGPTGAFLGEDGPVAW